MKIGVSLTVVLLSLLAVAVAMNGWDRPPLETEQIGYRGTGMEKVTNPRDDAKLAASNQAPASLDPAPADGERASAAYQNVKVLGDISRDQFDRLMISITEWVSPEQGCGYCHNEDNLASDEVYTKVVARRMIEMTRHINTDWEKHVGEVGVTCYTCHRGNPVPPNNWSKELAMKQAGGMAGGRAGQNLASSVAGGTALPSDPFSKYLNKESSIRVVGKAALPSGEGASIQHTEETYGLMIHLSQALGVNCTHCHNSRSFFAWDQSTPARQTAYQGLSMVRDVNTNFLDPLQSVFPADKLGPHGDVKKTNCATCHNGRPKPLDGVSMLKDYLELKSGNN